MHQHYYILRKVSTILNPYEACHLGICHLMCLQGSFAFEPLDSWSYSCFFLLLIHLLQALTTPHPPQLICSSLKGAGGKLHWPTLCYISTSNNNTYSKVELALVFFTLWRSTPTITPKWQNGLFPPFTGELPWLPYL